MSNDPAPSHGVMEGKGAYNRYAKLPAGGAALALPLLEKAVHCVALDTRDQGIVIADYGSSQGKNSMVPMQIAIRSLRRRVGGSRPISVFHVDQPSNDFNALFEVLDADPDRYVLDDPNVFPSAIGRSFYESVLPPDSVHLGWCSYAAVWLSRIPTLIPGHFISFRSTDAVRAEFDRQASQDWEAFLSLRARESRPGGRLVVVLPALADDGTSGFENIMDQANAVLAEMVADSAITAEERLRMVIRAHPRRKRDLLAPFARDGHFQHLEIPLTPFFNSHACLQQSCPRSPSLGHNRQGGAANHTCQFTRLIGRWSRRIPKRSQNCPPLLSAAGLFTAAPASDEPSVFER
jgi:S-adenosylmethionine-dependent carboxyl methyltransferase